MTPLSTRQRWILLGGGLALTAGLAIWLGPEPEPEEAVAPRPRPAAARPGGEAGEIRNLFSPQSWKAAPVAEGAPAPAAAAAPEMPALPFTYFGKLIDGGRVTVYLAGQDRNLAVHQGDVIDGTWRVESIRPGGMVFNYLPMGKRVALEIGRSK